MAHCFYRHLELNMHMALITALGFDNKKLLEDDAAMLGKYLEYYAALTEDPSPIENLLKMGIFLDTRTNPDAPYFIKFKRSGSQVQLCTRSRPGAAAAASVPPPRPRAEQLQAMAKGVGRGAAGGAPRKQSGGSKKKGSKPKRKTKKVKK